MRNIESLLACSACCCFLDLLNAACAVPSAGPRRYCTLNPHIKHVKGFHILFSMKWNMMNTERSVEINGSSMSLLVHPYLIWAGS